MNEVNTFLEKGILQAIRNLLPVKSILRDSLQEDDDDAIQVTPQDDVSEKPAVATEEPKVEEPKVEEPKVEEPKVEEPKVDELKDLEVTETPRVVEVTKTPQTVSATTPETLVIDTEKSVGFTGFDSVFGTMGDAEMKPMVEEGDDELKIIGDLEDLNIDDIEDLDRPLGTNTPLGADDYETL
jgi:hypothetical protein